MMFICIKTSQDNRNKMFAFICDGDILYGTDIENLSKFETDVKFKFVNVKNSSLAAIDQNGHVWLHGKIVDCRYALELFTWTQIDNFIRLDNLENKFSYVCVDDVSFAFITESGELFSTTGMDKWLHLCPNVKFKQVDIQRCSIAALDVDGNFYYRIYNRHPFQSCIHPDDNPALYISDHKYSSVKLNGTIRLVTDTGLVFETKDVEWGWNGKFRQDVHVKDVYRYITVGGRYVCLDKNNKLSKDENCAIKIDSAPVKILDMKAVNNTLCLLAVGNELWYHTNNIFHKGCKITLFPGS